MIIAGYSRTFGSSFVPTDISGLQIWFDFSDISTLYQDSAKTTAVTSNNDPIGAVEDKSGNGRDCLQATGSRRPTYKTSQINGLSAAQFGTSIDMNTATYTPVTQPITGFMVAKLDQTDSNYYIPIDGTSSYRCSFVYHPTLIGGSPRWGQFFGTERKLNNATTDTNPHYFSSIGNGSSSQLWVDGVVPGGVGPGNAGTGGSNLINLGSNVTAGGNTYWPGLIAEFLFYNSSLSTADREAVEAYLASKWNI